MGIKHYKLPYDDEIDKDILEWIDGFHRTKKGEMVRHAIRYYMAMEGESIGFPNVAKANTTNDSIFDNPLNQQDKNRKERVRPIFNPNALK